MNFNEGEIKNQSDPQKLITGTLSEIEIRRRLNPKTSEQYENRITVTPLLDPNDQIKPSGIDLRLGKQFIVFKNHLQDSLNPRKVGEDIQNIFKYQEEHVIGLKDMVILHPNQFVIGSTFEYIGLPGDLEARIDGRSSWSRMGLIIATATTIHPHFQGVITLELSNQGSIPIQLYPCLKIAFMTFKVLSDQVQKKEKVSRYDYAVGPGYSKIHDDKHMEYFVPKRSTYLIPTENSDT